jgi:uncharacterized protein DUF3309
MPGGSSASKHTLGIPPLKRARKLASNCQVVRPRATLVMTGSSAQDLGTILLIILIVGLLGVLPTWGYSRSWGYGPSGIIGLIVVVLVILLLIGRL